MKVVTAQTMAEIDRLTIEGGTPGVTLMRNAGAAVFDRIMSIMGDLTETFSVAVVAGKGNNGGDGYRVAELLAQNGVPVTVYLVAEKTAVSGDALTCLRDAERIGVDITEVTSEDAAHEISHHILSADVIVDALFGTGLTGDIRGYAAVMVRSINASDGVVFAVDVPSGVDATTGNVSVDTVHADCTVTFGCYKAGHLFGPGRLLCGDTTVVDIGFDNDILESAPCAGFALTHEEAAHRLPARPYDSHKGTAGRVFILAGSVGLTGAATLSALGALRSGAGLVTVGCPSSLNDILEVKLTEAMTLPLPEVRNKRCLSLRALGKVRAFTSRMNAVALGPGIGTYHETRELLRRFLDTYEGRVIIDADGLNCFSGEAHLIKQSPAEVIITPHAGELSRLTGIPIPELLADPAQAAKNAVDMTGAVVLFKGAPSCIASTDGEIWFNPTGNQALATGGTGDVLTGVIAGLAGQGLPMRDAAVLGAYIHGRAGEYASHEKGIRGVITGDVIDMIPAAVSELERG